MSITNKKEKVLVLHDIRSVLNVGAIFRTADAVGINKIYISGHTPAPVDRFGRERNDIKKTALGAQKSVKWEQVENVLDLISDLKKTGFEIVSLEQSKKSIDYKEVGNNIGDKVAVILGSETKGVSEEILNKSNLIVEIPMVGEKESLNVSVATGILLYRLFDN
jgi:tRNA G18 (ribose-2'-O)-methylase SpoU